MYCKTCIYREGTQCTNPHVREDNFDDCDGWDGLTLSPTLVVYIINLLMIIYE